MILEKNTFFHKGIQAFIEGSEFEGVRQRVEPIGPMISRMQGRSFIPPIDVMKGGC
jgi:hypothetical protein